MYPNRQEALSLLKEAEERNPGAWGDHSRTAAHCAEKIAARCAGMDADKAYVLGLLHDIGRRFGVYHLKHISDGCTYMTALGYDEVARVCLSHSFHNRTVDEYIGRFDTTEEELEMIRSKLNEMVYDDYDRLIQLCDAIAGVDGVVDMEARMLDVKRRYGAYPQAKWDANFALKRYFEEKMRQDLYEAVEKESFRPGLG